MLGADAAGEGSLTYRWAATTLPDGAAPPVFSDNSENSAKNTIATFSHAGAYGFTVTISDPGGLTATSSVNVIVSQTQTTIRVNGSPLVATACDQFGNPLVNQPGIRRKLGYDYRSAGDRQQRNPASGPAAPH